MPQLWPLHIRGTYSHDIQAHMDRLMLYQTYITDTLAQYFFGMRKLYGIRDLVELNAIRTIAASPRSTSLHGMLDWWTAVNLVAPLGYAMWTDIAHGL